MRVCEHFYFREEGPGIQQSADAMLLSVHSCRARLRSSLARQFSDPLALGDHDKAEDAVSLTAKILPPFLRTRRAKSPVFRSPGEEVQTEITGFDQVGGDPAAQVGTLKGGGLAREVVQEGGVSSKPGHLNWM